MGFDGCSSSAMPDMYVCSFDLCPFLLLSSANASRPNTFSFQRHSQQKQRMSGLFGAFSAFSHYFLYLNNYF